MSASKFDSFPSFRHPILPGEQVGLPIRRVNGRPVVAFHLLFPNHPPGYAMKVANIRRAGPVISSTEWMKPGEPSDARSGVVYYDIYPFFAGDLFMAGVPHSKVHPFYGRVEAGLHDGDGEELVVERLAADRYRRQAQCVCPYHVVDLPRPARVARVRKARSGRVDFSGCTDVDLIAEAIARGLLQASQR